MDLLKLSSVSFLIGIASGFLFHPSEFFTILLLFLAVIFSVFYFFEKERIFGFVSIALFLFAGALLRVHVYEVRNTPLLDTYRGETVSFTGVVSSEPERKEKYMRYVVKIESLLKEKNIAQVKQNILVYDDIATQVSFGNTVEFLGSLSSPKDFSEGDNNFSWVRYLKKDAIFYEVFYPEIKVVRDEGENSFVRFRQVLFTIKHLFIENLEKTIPEPESSLAKGELVGEKASLGKELESDLRRVGVSHIVVLSGYNVTIIADSIIKMLSFLPRAVSLYSGIGGILLFVLFSGGGATIVRASIMAILVILARYFGKLYDIGNALFFATICMVFVTPTILLFDPSFQLSVLATIGIMYSTYTERFFTFITKKFSFREIFSSTISAQAFVLPLLLFITGEVSLIAPLANLLILPVIPLTMLLSFLTGISGFLFSYAGLLFGMISSLILSYQIFIVEKLSLLPFASVSVSSKILPAVLIFYCGGLIYFLFKKRLTINP
jgi:competence protein ComEC